MIRIGVDVGGTKIEVVALDDGDGELARERVATPAGDYDATITTIVGLVGGMEKRLGASGSVGVGIPGSISPTTSLVRNANSTWLNGRAFRTDLEAGLARAVRVENDANCFAISEAIDGAGAGRRVVFGVILGTGVGGGIVVDGRVMTGRNGIAGEWGHNGLPRVEPGDLPLSRCWCGRDGCIETFLSGPALLADHRAHGGVAVDASEVATRSESGDAIARATIDRYGDRLARSLASVIDIVDPDVIVLGGGLSNIDALYAAMPRRMAPLVFSDVVTTPIVRNRHGDSSGVRGAARLWPATAS